MDRNKIARLLRELADELESDDATTETSAVLPTARPVSDIEKAKARKILRAKGLRV